MAPIAEALRRADGRHWAGIGTVLPAQGGQHYDTHDGQDVTVEVELHPSGRIISCRIGAAAGGPDQGVWSIPEPGDEVAVIVPDGEEDAGGVVVCCLSSGAAPDLAAVRTVLVKADVVIVQAGDVQLGSSGLTPPLDGVVTGRGIDPFTGASYGTLGNASSVVKAKKEA